MRLADRTDDYADLERLDRPALDDEPSRACALAAALLLLACASPPSFDDSGHLDAEADSNDDASPPPFGDGGPPDAGCENLECRIPKCDGAAGTTISGTVFDPAAMHPLYNVLVYVPNHPLDPIPDGPSCTQCQGAASGKPIVSTLTDAKGHFQLKNVPAGDGIPLVMQLGKWRRKIVLQHVDACVDNVLDPVADRTKTRLPRSEGEFGDKDNHIPRIAITTGCDMAQCFLLKRIGIDNNEFTGPSGKGRVHMYAGEGYSNPLYGPQGATMGDAYGLWGDLNAMKKYDLIINTCECSPNVRDTAGPAYANMKSYLDSGGRAFLTHFHYNFFASSSQCSGDVSCKGPTDFNGVADWTGDAPSNATDYLINSTFPKGKAFADWLDYVTVPAHTYGHVGLVDTRTNVAAVKGPTTTWIYTPNNPYYLTFNAPVGLTPDNQCGRAVFSGVHLSGGYAVVPLPTPTYFPTYCKTPSVDHSPNEDAMEFLFFDLSSCVQDDTQPPPVPN